MLAVLDLLGAFFTLITFLALAGGGFLAALALLGDSWRRDRLALATASILLSLTGAIAIALFLGAFGHLRFPWALAALLASVALLARHLRSSGIQLAAARGLSAALRERLRADAPLAVLAATGVGSELMRGLLRPPLSWDSLMYHLRLAAEWLRSGDLLPPLAAGSGAYYGYVPANGSLWLWWWLAPSHSEFYVNLASLAHWLLLGLAAGAVARELGARRFWPAVSFVVLLLPTVARFVGTQYVDLLASGALVAASFFALRWLSGRRLADAVLAGCGLGLAAGSKVLAAPAVLALGLSLAVFMRGEWRRRLAHAAVAGALVAALGAYFYARNVALGAGPLGSECAGPTPTTFPRLGSLFDYPGRFFEQARGLDVLLGITSPPSLEMGLGPIAIPLFGFLAVLPIWVWRRGDTARRFVAIQVGVGVLLWTGIPDWLGNDMHANVRYMLPTVAWLCASCAAFLEERQIPLYWVQLGALAVGAQSLLQFYAQMPRGVRLAFATFMAAGLVLVLSAKLRWLLRAHRAVATLLAIGAGFLAVPVWTAFRTADRARALGSEFTLHETRARSNANAWAWLEDNAGDRSVAVIGANPSLFVYPAMGPRFTRAAGYINVNRENHRFAHRYPGCDPRKARDAEQWLANLRTAGAAFLHVAKMQGQKFPLEDGWASARPAVFHLRYEDPLNRVYEITGTPPR